MGHWAIAQPTTWRARRCNRPFAASHSRGTKPPFWRANVALGEDKQKTYRNLNVTFLFLSCLSATFALQRGGFCTTWMATWKEPQNSCPARLHPPGTKFSTGIASRVIKSHKPPHHVKAQHLGREHTAVEWYIVSTNAYNHFPRKLPLIKLTNLAWLYCQSFYLTFIPSPFVCILLYKHRNCFNLFRKRNQDCWKRRKEIG